MPPVTENALHPSERSFPSCFPGKTDGIGDTEKVRQTDSPDDPAVSGGLLR